MNFSLSCCSLGVTLHVVLELMKSNKSAFHQNTSKRNVRCHFLAGEPLLCPPLLHPASMRLKFMLPTVNTIHINRLLTVVRSRMQNGYIYKCFPQVPRQPRAFPHDERRASRCPSSLPILVPFHPHHHCSYHPGNLIISRHYTLLP